MTKKILRIIAVAVMLVAVVVYAADIIINETSPIKHINKISAVVLCCVVILLKLSNFFERQTLQFYEKSYEKDLGGAFKNDSRSRKKLIKAARFHNENNYSNAIKLLNSLQRKCKEEDDFKAVYLFTAMAYKREGLLEKAVDTYAELIDMGYDSSLIYSNLGNIYLDMGDDENAFACLQDAIELDPNNSYAYSNLASLYFNDHDFDNAIEYAKEALRLNKSLYQAASLLTIVYSLRNNTEEAQKYYHIAISNGSDPLSLRRAIRMYKADFFSGDGCR